MPVGTCVSLTIDAPVARVFDIASSIPPRELVRPYGPLPGAVQTAGAEIWREIGDRRRRRLTDGSSVDEELTGIVRASHFSYRLADFTDGFSNRVRSGCAEWRFTPQSADKTRIDWTYSFEPHGPAARACLWLIVKLLWPGYLRAALRRVKLKAEAYP